ncbi:MAG: MBL fold metallo-hydrolase [Anaerolineae bacterium]|nr:MBL fold metallo-hydrolase [Anaerolineae bacterium]MBN8617950.1 MBL fold metallo-hydrolase [Anaerolineae bacterium]
MQRERVADDIYIFTSDLYAQVTAGVILTTEGAVVLDTLAYPEETLMMKRFIEARLGTTVRYVINTHFHADHSVGTCFFKGAHVVSHALCRELLDTRGRTSLEKVQSASNEMRDVHLVLPDIVFADGPMTLHLGNKTLQFWASPGHSADSIVCLVKEDRVLFAADTLMPIPYFVDGSFDDFVASLNLLRNGNYENVIQGHGEIILRGEVEEKIQEDIDYLNHLRTAVDQALTQASPERALDRIDIESCGKSRILLNGAVTQLHRQNVLALAAQRRELVQY